MLGLSVHWSYSERDKIFEGSEEFPNTLAQSMRAHVTNFAALYGISENLTVSATLPYLRVRFEDQGEVANDAGFGDLGLVVRALAANRHAINLQLAAGLTVPLDAGVRNPISSASNFVSGTVDPLFAVTATLPLGADWQIGGRTSARVVVADDSDGNRAGSFFSWGAAVRRAPLGSSLELDLTVLSLHRGHDELNGVRFPNSGGNWVSVEPGASWNLPGSLHGTRLRAGLELLVHRDVNGTQLSEDWTGRISLTHALTLR